MDVSPWLRLSGDTVLRGSNMSLLCEEEPRVAETEALPAAGHLEERIRGVHPPVVVEDLVAIQPARESGGPSLSLWEPLLGDARHLGGEHLVENPEHLASLLRGEPALLQK